MSKENKTVSAGLAKTPKYLAGTKRIEKIKKEFFTEKELKERILAKATKDVLALEIKNIKAIATAIATAIAKAIDDTLGWLPVYNAKNEKLYYHIYANGLLPDMETFNLESSDCHYSFPSNYTKTFAGFTGRLIKIDEGNLILGYEKKAVLINKLHFKLNYSYWSIPGFNNPIVFENTNGGYRLDSYRWGDSSHNQANFNLPFKSLGPLAKQSNSDILLLLLQNHLHCEGIKPEEQQQLEALSKEPYKPILVKLMDGESLTNEDKKILSKEAEIAKKITALNAQYTENINAQDGLLDDALASYLLNIDNMRCDLDPYDARLLDDPQRGHWDLWNLDESDGIAVKSKIYARDPHNDINPEGIVSIDFGTKSTVVAFQQKDERIMPMRIGTGKISGKVSAEHYENPTVLEFVDLKNFILAYNADKEAGRPKTLWKDLNCSYTAKNAMDNCDSTKYAAYLKELKQWAGDKSRVLSIEDDKGFSKELPPYLQLSEEDFDPIELYAYYIGCYINNMNASNGIFLKYCMSFPVTYEESIREKLLNSFTKGIKKSLPTAILNDALVMEDFEVKAGISEPSAYAVCALQEFAVKGEDEEKCFYGVFDFGGGTADFDFGIWRNPTRKNKRRYDYEMERLQSGGDPYLGGENLLELLAFNIFKENAEILRENEKEGHKAIPFILPPECDSFEGCEQLLQNNSKQAKVNMNLLSEKLRSFWEAGNTDNFSSSVLKIELFDVDGKKINLELSVNEDNLKEILEKRIKKGIDNFFTCLELCIEKNQEKLEGIEKINILLAGNSSKSAIFQELIKNAINELEDFEYVLYPPLGTEEAENKIKEREVAKNETLLVRPNGKTGVAMGLLMSRSGIKITNPKVSFRFFIGYKYKNLFYCIPEDGLVEYNTWYELMDADEKEAALFYTPLSIATKEAFSIAKCNKKILTLKKAHEDCLVFVRAISSDTIEYCVAEDEDCANAEEYVEEPVKMQLG